jgi:cytidylate kinase
MLAERLGYRALSREVLVESAEKYRIGEEILQEELTKPPSLWQRLTHERRRYLIFIKCSLIQHVARGGVVYHGNAGQVLLEGIHGVLRVRVEAPLPRRIEAEMRLHGLDRDEAAARISRADERRRRWVKYLYDRDWDDASLYDLTINLATMSLDTACDLICHAIGEPEFQPTTQSHRFLQDACLQCAVEAALASDSALWKQGLAVRASSGSVAISGEVEGTRQKARLDELVSQVDGVKQYSLDVGLASEPLPGGRRLSL